MTHSHNRNMIKDIIAQYKKFCESHGWTQQTSAEKIGCCRTHLSKIFSGQRNPSMKLLERIEEAMKDEK